MRVTFEIPGEPKGKGRFRFMRGGHTYTPPSTTEYETWVKYLYKQAAKGATFDKAPIRIAITAYYQIPASASNKKKAEMRYGFIRPTKRPDGDNILKIVADALNGGIAYHDDAQIVEATVKKFYADDPRVEVEIEEV